MNFWLESIARALPFPAATNKSISWRVIEIKHILKNFDQCNKPLQTYLLQKWLHWSSRNETNVFHLFRLDWKRDVIGECCREPFNTSIIGDVEKKYQLQVIIYKNEIRPHATYQSNLQTDKELQASLLITLRNNAARVDRFLMRAIKLGWDQHCEAMSRRKLATLISCHSSSLSISAMSACEVAGANLNS